MDLKTCLREATAHLASFSDTPAVDARLLLSYVLKVDYLRLVLMQDQTLSKEQFSEFQSLLQQRKKGIPIAYLIGKKSFWTMELEVDESVLIPRPESELIVEAALNLYSKDQTIDVIDLGTGSGAIAIALALECPRWMITAVDQSESALRIAKRNADNYQLKNISFLKSHWFDALKKQFHLVVSNPPYLSEKDPYLSTSIRYEPQEALVCGISGLEDLTQIISEAKSHLFSRGWLVLEHGFEQGEAVRNLLKAQNYQAISSLKDLQGYDRVSVAQVP